MNLQVGITGASAGAVFGAPLQKRG